MGKLTKKRSQDSLETVLWNTAHSTEEAIRPEAVEQVCGRVRNNPELTRRHRRIGFLSFLQRQMRFICCKIWLMQAGLLILFCALLEVSFQGCFTGDAKHIARYFACFLSCLSGAVLFSAVPLIYRSVRYEMYEMEMTTRFSCVKILAARLLAIGIGNVILLSGMLLFTVMRISLQADSVLLYLLLPYLTAGGGLLYLLGHIPAEKLPMGSVGLGCLIILVLVLLKRFWPAFFLQRFTLGWGMVCLILLLFCAEQVRYLMHRSMYAKVQI